MQDLLTTGPPPAPAPKPGETREGAQPKTAQALSPARERFIPRAHLDTLWDRLLDVDTLDKAAARA